MERKGEKEIERQGEPQRRKMREVERQVREMMRGEKDGGKRQTDLEMEG